MKEKKAEIELYIVCIFFLAILLVLIQTKRSYHESLSWTL